MATVITHSPRLMRIGVLASLFILSRPHPSESQEPKPDGQPDVTIKTDVPYAKANGTELKLDLVLPKTKGPHPAVLVIHGGAWRGGNKKDCMFIMPDFARRGYAAISPQYRFCPGETFPAQVQDVKAAVRWVRAHAGEYDIDPGRIGAMGFSAGGHLAMMLGLTSPDDGLEGEGATGAPVSRVQAVVNYFGPTDLAADDLPDVSKSLVKDFLGGSPKEKPELAGKASPLSFVSRWDAPVLTFQGTKDPLVPATQAIKLAEKMTSAGVPGRVELLVGAQHGWGGAELERTKAETFAFFDAYLKPGAQK
jgi:acetyl esterase/lipase